MSGLDPSIYKLSDKVASLKYLDLLPTAEDSQLETREFLQKIIDILMDYIELCFNRDEPCLNFHQTECLRKKIDMDITTDGVPLSQLITDCVMTLKLSVKSGHRRFMNQLANGLDIISMAGEWLTATANSNTFTYEVAPVFITMEHVLLQKMRGIVGWSTGESTFAPGGTICNLYAVLVARYNKFSDVKQKGMRPLPGQLVVFTSNQCHYSVKVACNITGIGLDNLISVDSDERGRMKPEVLDQLLTEQKAKGNIPIMVNATAGTTVFGAFDPLNAIADICEKHNVWMHVDVSEGGFAI